MTSAVSSNPTPKAGRNLPAAIGVGLLLVGLIITSLLVVHWGFTLLATVSMMVGVVELRDSLAKRAIHVPLIPCLLATAVMMPAAFFWGPTALLSVLAASLLVLVLWRAAFGLAGAARDVCAGVFVLGYAPFLASFSSLMLAPSDGVRRIFVFVAVTVASDIGGYATGVLAGKHPMAPSVSPKKSWEGFAGGTAACILFGVVFVPLVLGGPWWAGAILGAVLSPLATLGDLTESMIKRDLGIKDMGRLLPGHGGIMDRLDSLLVTAPASWILLSLMVPVA